MNGKVVYICDENREHYRDMIVNFQPRIKDIKEISYFGIEVDEVIMNIIYNTTEELYLYIDENNKLKLIFGMKIEDKVGRPFILQSYCFDIKKNKREIYSITKRFLTQIFKPMVEELVVFKPTKILDYETDNFLQKLGFKIEVEETYKIGNNYFLKYKQ